MPRAKVTYAAPKQTDPITDDQIMLFCRLIDDLIEHCNQGETPASNSPEYVRWLLGLQACGFVCRDLMSDPAIITLAEKPRWVEKAKFKEVRLYFHTLSYLERLYDRKSMGDIRPVYAAIQSGVLQRLSVRLRTAMDWRGL
jgi:hypothetical protein